MSGESLTHKLLRAHVVAGELVPGSDITVAVDQVLIEDATGTMCAMQFEMLAEGLATVESVAVPLAVPHRLAALQLAVMIVCPAVSALARPVLFTVATVVLDALHVTSALTSWVV